MAKRSSFAEMKAEQAKMQIPITAIAAAIFTEGGMATG